MSRSPCTLVPPSRRQGPSAQGHLRSIAIACSSFVLLIAWSVRAPAAQGAPALPPAIVTILQGKAIVIRGVTEFDVAEGMRLLADDIVRSETDTFLRLEYPDQSWLELGPQTELQLRPLSNRRNKRPGLYLQSGWLKLEGKAGPDAAQGIAIPGADMVDLSGVLVVHLEQQSLAVFAEKGAGRWVDRAPKATATLTLKNGDFLLTGPDNVPKVQNRPTPQFLEMLPRPYRDTLPARYSIYANRTVNPKGERAFSYSEVERWLDGEPAIRRQFVTTWRRKLHEADFRDSLDRQMQMHMEWDPVLHPEKYLPPEEVDAAHPKPTATATAPAGSVSTPR